MSSSATPTAIHHNVVPSEVGWQFVPQYYTFVNKQPNRLHCFYTKSSTFIHGTEGEDGKPCYGQQEIHNKITSIGFQDCKVFIHSVDAQSSANGGIIIQVIGEMSNHGDPWRKFVQTFFLAEQPNGYFVLNDIFRFLKEETVEGDDVSETAETPELAATAAVPEPAADPIQPAPPAEPTYEPPREPTPPPAPAVAAPPPAAPTPYPPADEAPTTDVPEPTAQSSTPAPETQPQATSSATTAQTNGIHTPEPEQPAPAPVIEKSPAPTPAPTQPAAAETASAPAPAPTPAAAPAKPTAAQVPPPAAAQPAAPPAPKTWASLAATNSKKWGSNVAQESRGITEAPSTPTPSSGTQTPVAHPPAAARGPGPQGQRGEHPALVAAQSVTSAQCFIKGVTDPVSQNALSAVLSQRFGPIKDLEIVRSKACAFIEFNTVESAKRAIIASLSQNQGGEGGVWVDGGDAGQIRISVETKKERGDRPVSRPRGGAPQANGDGRGGAGGGFRGRGTGRGGRGAGPK
ncbi:hypothetical protein BDQ12DRAFT_631309 [Crucibulum laeve]|uniref:NTF2 domain-containing protein n=1 Tax=Crucibulum laeve TaxID=68775 RepID=A0A5C3MAD2_9AGAR|nr:hypothetical protein BDQ12DRAFT_631309 [Crucibulum laeve]